MKNFGRAVRMALRYRFTFAASIFCAMMVAVLWGANITAVYPFVEVIFGGRSLREWVDERVDSAAATVTELEQRIDELHAALPAASKSEAVALRGELSRAETRLVAEQKALGWYEWARPSIHQYLPGTPFQTLLVVIALLLLGTLLKSLFFVGQNILVSRLAQLATFNLRKSFYRRTLRMDLKNFTEEGSGELMSRFTYDMESLVQGINLLFGKLVREPLKMLACLVGAAWICWRLLLLSLVVAPLAAFLMGKLARTLKRANRRAMEEMSQIYGVLEETLQGIKIVKAFTMERYERRRFHKISKKYYAKAMRIARYDSLTRPVSEMMGICTICVALMLGAYLVLGGETHLFGIRMTDRPLSLASLLVFYSLLAGSSDPARKLTEVFNRLQRATAAADRIYAMIDREPTVRNAPGALALARHHRELVFDNVSFRYYPDTPVLEAVDLMIPYGETVAIVGPNGCGKSTLVNLIPRFFDPNSGNVRIDGVDLREARLRDIRSQIGLVTQETLLFDDSIANNIRYGCPWATEEQVIQAAKQAHAHRFIMERLEQQYETHVGPGGCQLSGGQRQRIALARAILRDPAILILDEATSQIDLESEQLIHKVLEQFIRPRTTVIITHRMSTLTLADRIVVMDAGRILDVGSHNELLARCELYRKLHTIQFREIA